MPMRMSGLMSGMDTESVISQLVEARSTKLNKTKKAQTKLSWKQDAWKELNKKLKNLQSKFASNMRFTSAYSKKTTKVSNSSIASVITGENAVNGVQTLRVEQLAKTGYLTGAKLGDGEQGYTAMTTLGELGLTGEGAFSVKTSKGTTDIKVTGDTTISDVLTQLKNAGLNASFDAKTQRFFVSAKESGVKNDFSITASDANGAAALSAMGLQVNLNDDKATLAEYKKYADYVGVDQNDTIANIRSKSTVIQDEIASRKNSYLKKYESAKAAIEAAEKKKTALDEKYSDGSLKKAEEYASDIETANASIKTIEDALATGTLTADEARDHEEQLVKLKEQVSDLTTRKKDAESYAAQEKAIAKAEADIEDAEKYVTINTDTVDGKTVYSATEKEETLVKEVEDKYYDKAVYAKSVMDAYDPEDKTATGATKVSGQDARIYLNDALFENNTNVFDINGLTITANSETAPGETVTITTQNDTDGIYDMIKDFFKEYNSIINEMDKLYNADSAKGYEPLTDEEKEAMSESEIEKYENKIKDALFRNDSDLSNISSALKTIMSSGVKVNGKTMYLSNFGINTLGYFNAADNEKNAYHIDGDPDDANTSGNADVLKGMIASDPDTVIAFFTGLSKNLYSKMSEMSSRVEGYRSFGNFFDDKKLESDYNDYTTKISDLEKKLNDYEDKWYKKFAKMETAMAKLQSKSNAFAGLLGGQ